MEGLILMTGRQVRKPLPRQFGMEKRQAFLDALALTCNINRSAAFAGVAPSTVHRRQAADATFAAAWQTALEMGYDRLETLALEHSGAGAAVEADPERAAAAGADAVPFDFDKALKLLMFHRAARHGQRQTPKGGAPAKNLTREETNKLLLKALAAAKRRVEQSQVGMVPIGCVRIGEAGAHEE